jgi:hypothetical protein
MPNFVKPSMNGFDCTKPKAGLFPDRHLFVKSKRSSDVVVEGEKRYRLHIALGRDLNADGTVDVLGTQLEEVVE